MTINERSYSVSEINSRIKYLLENSISRLRVVGEISNFHHHRNSGHMYFSLKDKSSEIRCIMFRPKNSSLDFIPKDGMEVYTWVDVTAYAKKGQLQLNIITMEPAGIGALYKKYENLKKKLLNEGLFDKKYKKRIPTHPKRIGLITSEYGAALQDILNVVRRRAPNVTMLLFPVDVQGESSSNQIVEGIKKLNNNQKIDILILGRGGGSIEDLWSFNEETVARAIFESSIPIITAIGHETDFTIADFVSDLRAPTPSAAAELAVPDVKDLLLNLKQLYKRFTITTNSNVKARWVDLDNIEQRFNKIHPLNRIREQHGNLTNFYKALKKVITEKNNYNKSKIVSLHKQLNSLGPRQVMKRGYSIALDAKGEIIKSSNKIKVGESFTLKTSKGRFIAKKTSDKKLSGNGMI